mgnify:CR=1 FL=1
MTRREMSMLVLQALADLRSAMEDLCQPLEPDVPLPRFRRFQLIENIEWPYVDPDGITDPSRIGAPERWDYYYYLPCSPKDTRSASISAIIGACRDRPARILRVIRRIEAAAAWCRARAEGRRRAAEEILRQQAKALETLEAMAAQEALAGLSRQRVDERRASCTCHACGTVREASRVHRGLYHPPTT